MPEILPTHEFRTKSYNRYDWDSWLDGQTWRLISGTDYHGPASNIIRAAIRTARQRGKKLLYDVVEENGKPESVIIQVIAQDVKVLKDEYCADCGKKTAAPIYWCGTSARCPDCHAKRMSGVDGR